MTTTPAEAEWAVNKIESVLAALIVGDTEAAADAITDLAMDSVGTLFGAAGALAAVVLDPEVPHGDYSLEVIDVRTGAHVTNPGDPKSAEALWLGRFVAAAGNDDVDTQMALFRVVLDDVDLLLSRVCALASLAAKVLKRRAEASS